jgi:hypothetical protein
VLEEMVLQAQSTKPTINKKKKGLQAYNLIRMSLEAYSFWTRSCFTLCTTLSDFGASKVVQ